MALQLAILNNGKYQNMKINQTTKAALVAPWASLIVVIYALGQELLALNSDSTVNFGAQILSTFLLFLIFVFGFVSISYLMVTFIGVPAHWLFLKLKVKHWGFYIATGVAIALVIQFLLYMNSDVPAQLRAVGYMSYGISAIFVSIVFWYIAVGSRRELSDLSQ